MNIRVYRYLVFGVAIVVPALGGSQLPIPGQAFGKIEGVIDFCVKADSANSAKYEKSRKELVKDVSDSDLLEMRKTQEYKDGYGQARSEFLKMPKGKAIKACTASLENK